jgi:hypothetical protein
MMDIDLNKLADCLEACVECAETCASCADACLGEEDVSQLKRCIRLNEDCNDICEAAASILSRQTETDYQIVRDLILAMRTACRLCAEECERHARMHDHCRVCAEACRHCEQTCDQTIQVLPLAA